MSLFNHLESCTWLAGNNPEIHENGGREWICDGACMVGKMPLMKPRHRRGELDVVGPDSIPMSLLRPHEGQALSTHSQTLNGLASRGGLSPIESLAIIEGWNPFKGFKRYTREEDQKALDKLVELVKEHESASPSI